MYVLVFIQLSQMGTLQSKKCARVYSFAFITKGQHLGYLNSTSARGLPIGSHWTSVQGLVKTFEKQATYHKS